MNLTDFSRNTQATVLISMGRGMFCCASLSFCKNNGQAVKFYSQNWDGHFFKAYPSMRKESCLSMWEGALDQVYYISLGCMLWPVFSFRSHLASELILEGNCSTDWRSVEGGWTSAADRLQCSGDRLIWCWATAKFSRESLKLCFFGI